MTRWAEICMARDEDTPNQDGDLLKSQSSLFCETKETGKMSGQREELGFEPQQETPYNKLLPYAEVLDKESNEQLAEIKAQLGRTIQLRDIKVGSSHWIGQLSK